MRLFRFVIKYPKKTAITGTTSVEDFQLVARKLLGNYHVEVASRYCVLSVDEGEHNFCYYYGPVIITGVKDNLPSSIRQCRMLPIIRQIKKLEERYALTN